MLVFGAFRLDLAEEQLWKGTRQLTIRRKPFSILRYLATNPRRLITHDELLTHVWGGAVVSESALRTHLHELRQLLGEGLIETVIGRGYRFTAAVTEAAHAVPPPPVSKRLVVGRDEALATLRAALERAREGNRQICFLTGEPGIGKTTVVDTLFDEIEHTDVIAARGQCIEQHGTPEAYLALIDLLGRLRQSRHGDATVAALVRLAPTLIAQLPHFVPEQQLAEVTRRAAGGTEARMMRELIEAIEEIASQFVIVVALEDLQWSDVATIDFLSMLGQRRERAKLLVIGTARRAEAQTVSHPLNRVLRTLTTRAAATHIPLEPIELGAITGLLAARFPDHRFPEALAATLGRITNGTPLFLVSMLDDLVARGMIAERDGAWMLTVGLDDLAQHRPDSLTQLIDIQLDRLTSAEQRAIEAGSAVGLEWTTALVGAALGLPEEAVDETFDELARRSLFVRRVEAEAWPDGTMQTRYAVTHGLVHEVCLARTPPARRQGWHRKIGDRLEAAYGPRAPEIAHLLATHFERGQATRQAIGYYMIAGARTARRFASLDAISLYQRAHSLVLRLAPSPERDRLELDALQGLTSMFLRGYQEQTGDPLAAFLRMIELARNLDDKPSLCASLINTSIRCTTLGDYRRAAALCDEVDAIAATIELEPRLIEIRNSARVLSMIWQGDIVPAAAMLERLLSADSGLGEPTFDAVLPDRHAVNLAYLVMLRWLVGDVDSALREGKRACQLALDSADPWTIGLAYCNLSRICMLARSPVEDVRQPVEQVLAMSLAAVWHGPAKLLVSWADSKQGRLDASAVDAMVNALRERLRQQPMGPSMLALPVIDALRNVERHDEALELVNEMLATCRQRNERVLEPELVRVRGELAQRTDRAAALRDYREALELARSMSALALELRAAVRLAETDPTTLPELAAIVARCTQGLETPDLLEAKQLLA